MDWFKRCGWKRYILGVEIVRLIIKHVKRILHRRKASEEGEKPRIVVHEEMFGSLLFVYYSTVVDSESLTNDFLRCVKIHFRLYWTLLR